MEDLGAERLDSAVDFDVLQLQRLAGNAAVAHVIQRDGDERARPGQQARGMDVRAALQTQLPGLLAALSSEQVAQWQAQLDYQADQQRQTRELGALSSEFNYLQGYQEHSADYRAKKRRIEATARPKPAAGPGTSVDPRLLLSDDILDPPAWDRDAEVAFRNWAVARVTEAPLQIKFADPDQDQFNLHATSGLASFTKGVINPQALQSYFPDEYRQMVWGRPLWDELRMALREMNEAIYDSKSTHKEWLQKNRTTNWFIVWTAEALGEGDTDLPAEDAWTYTDAMVQRSFDMLRLHQLELLAPHLEQAAQAAYKVITDVEAYDKRVTTGAQVAIKWANRLKTVGSIAAGIASGGLGLAGSALVAGGYTFVQSGAQQASEVGHGLRDKMDWGALTKEAGVTALLAVVGGALQTRFQAAWEPRLAGLGPTLGKQMSSAAAAGTSSFYVTGAEIAVKHFALGEPLPTSVDELSDMIITNALQNAGMDIATARLNQRANREYEAWKAKRTVEPDVSPATAGTKGVPALKPGKAIPGGKADPAKAQPSADVTPKPDVPAAVTPRQMPEAVVRSLLRSSGGWERVRVELQGGTGLGHGMSVAERRELLTRFEDHRQATAREVATLFDGEVATTGGAAGLHVEVRIGGPQATQHAADARAYLDARRPGWAQETALVVQPVAAPQIHDPGAVKAQKALERSTDPEVRRLAMAMGSRYASLPKGQLQRLDLLIKIVNENVRAAGAPDITVAATGNGPHFDALNWRLELPANFATTPNPTPTQFAEFCNTFAHEARHAIQMFQAARVASGAEALRMSASFRADVFQAAQGLGTAGSKTAKPLDPASLDYADARSYYDSIWGSGYNDRQALLMPGTGHLAVARTNEGTALAKEAVAAERLNKLKNDPPRSMARRIAQRQLDNARNDRIAAQAETQRQYDAYRNLAEEIDAWAHGDAVQAAALHYMDLRNALQNSQLAERRAHQLLSTARDAYLADPNAGQSGMRAYANALAQWRRISAEVEGRARALAAVATAARRK